MHKNLFKSEAQTYSYTETAQTAKQKTPKSVLKLGNTVVDASFELFTHTIGTHNKQFFQFSQI